ncbi:prohibitin family protein [Nannocystis sp. SCPEA4]|uniref:prohibitin family protein n=1 Tax=Nannocystis sp. SCPEA4 TaxID=2996787 RepID=UPI00226F4501|nr:prohibitin family protein [Nannocystis sp. SCPEA4]MCY1062648.1 prohibitin family protein [Nannocystis sp. SCPEA4]
MANTRETRKVDDRSPLREWSEKTLGRVEYLTYTALVVMLMLLGFLWPRMFITIPTGSQGVMYRYFAGGTVTDRVWGEGLHIIPPWDHLTLYEVRLQQKTLNFDVLSDEGLNLQVAVSVKFRPDSDMLGHLHRDIGPDYFERMIEPDIQAHVRRAFGDRPAYEIYSSANDLLLELRRISALGRDEPGDGEKEKPYVQIQEIELVDLELPEIVLAAIAESYRQKQLMLEYRHKLEREEAEAQRKRTEASGIRDYNTIIGELSPDVLRWRDLEVTSELAKAPNSKVLVLGKGSSNSSLLFNVGGDSTTDSTTAPASPAAAAPASASPAAP